MISSVRVALVTIALLRQVLIGLPQAYAQPNPQIQALLFKVSADSMRHTIAELSGEVPVMMNGVVDTIKSRQYNSPGNEMAFAYLKNRLIAYGITVDSQAYSATGKNLFGILKGSTDTGKVIMLGAHYDDAGRLVGPGADDNASGVAGVLECARVCASSSLAYTLMFAFWDEEEMASTGSTEFMQQRFLNKKMLTGYINMDMIGWDGNSDSVAEIHTRSVAASQSWAAKAVSVNNDYQIGLQTQLIIPGSATSDHASFWNSYQTAIGINEDYDGDMNPSWHKASDTLGNLDIAYAAKITRLTLGTALSYAAPSPTGILYTADTYGIHVFPNPFMEFIEVSADNKSSCDWTLSLINAQGKICASNVWSAGSPKTRISLAPLPCGEYFLSFHSRGGQVMETLQLVKVVDQ